MTARANDTGETGNGLIDRPKRTPDRLAMQAESYDVGYYPAYGGIFVPEDANSRYVQRHRVSIERRGPVSWAICYCGEVVDKVSLEFVSEPSPSNRNDEFIQRTRFASAEEAFECWKRVWQKIVDDVIGEFVPGEGTKWIGYKDKAEEIESMRAK